MRNKLFFAFLAVVLTALISNLLYEYFITRDFEDYVSGTKEDKLYWVLASVEGSYEKGRWDQVTLHDAIHWAIMLGFDVKVLDFRKKGTHKFRYGAQHALPGHEAENEEHRRPQNNDKRFRILSPLL